MATYKMFRCPHCNNYIPHEFMRPSGWNYMENVIGPPSEKCVTCGKTYRTNRDGWSNLPNRRKIGVFIRISVGVIYGSLAFTVITFMAIYLVGEIFLDDFGSTLLNWLDQSYFRILYILIPYILILSLKERKEFKNLTQLFP